MLPSKLHTQADLPGFPVETGKMCETKQDSPHRLDYYHSFLYWMWPWFVIPGSGSFEPVHAVVLK